MKTILSAGCSFLTKRNENIIPQVEVVAEKLNCNINNVAHQGRGNTYIVRKVIDSLQENSYDLVIIGWSSPFRWDFINPKEKPFALKIHQLLENDDIWPQKCDIDRTQFFRWANDVFLISEYFRSNNIKFVMFNSLPCWSDGDSNLHEYIKGMNEFVEYNNNQLDDGKKYGEHISANDFHPNQTGNNKWADKLHKKIKEIYP